MKSNLRKTLLIIIWSLFILALLSGIMEIIFFHTFYVIVGAVLFILASLDVVNGKARISSLLWDLIFLVAFAWLSVTRVKNMLNSSPTPTYRIEFDAEEVLNMTGSTGDKFVSYDKASGTFTSKYIPRDKMAKSQDEVAGVIIIENGEEYVGKYTNGVLGYKQYIKLSLLSTKTGKIVEEQTVYGYLPSSTSFFGFHRSNKYNGKALFVAMLNWPLKI